MLALLWAGWGVLVSGRVAGATHRSAGGGGRGRRAGGVGTGRGSPVVAVARWAMATARYHPVAAPGVLGLAALGGVWLVSFAIVASNVGVALCVVGGAAARVVGW
ncbi:hypothetical protein P9209_17180 [Prescottella defluvii]|nr:hypothetical protein P9209_17180 [Prescottella defluvii]